MSAPDPHAEPSARYVLLWALAVAVAYLGYRCFWFLTDDAFIVFRYVSNLRLGYGLTWNPPPFAPVEGYTSILWVVLLWIIWAVTGLAPPGTVNPLLFLFGCATLFLVARMVARMDLPPALARHRAALVALVLLGTVSNRTFLIWLSSGLDAALFNFLLTLWVSIVLARPEARGRRWVAGLTTAAVLAALARPDGLLLVAASAGLLALVFVEQPARRRDLLFALPLLTTPLHFVWRHTYYGAWLPNTWYAKTGAPWLESGWRYAASFVLEYAVWIWIGLALWWIVRRGRLSAAQWSVVAALACHFAYYTLVVGGDHFEYRVYSHLVPLLFASAVWLVARLDWSPRKGLALLVGFALLSLPIPWVHWVEMHKARGWPMVSPIAHHFPPGARAYVGAFDALQHWLALHGVCAQHREHAVFAQMAASLLPPRQEGAKIRWDRRPVIAHGNVGLLGWRLPHVAVIDTAGLNDYVVARWFRHPRKRFMAHDRKPPRGYVECFRPNVEVLDRNDPRAPGVVVTPRELDDEEIVRCETRYRRRLSQRATNGRG